MSAISIETLVLSRKYTDTAIEHVEEVAIKEAVEEAVAESKLYTDQEVSKILSFDIKVVSVLPQDPNNHTIYLVPKTLTAENNGYFEYIYVDEK